MKSKKLKQILLWKMQCKEKFPRSVRLLRLHSDYPLADPRNKN